MTEPNKAFPTPDEICAWLEAHGWERMGDPNESWITYEHPDLHESEVDVPRFHGDQGYKRHAVHAVELAAARLIWRDLSGFIRSLQPLRRDSLGEP